MVNLKYSFLLLIIYFSHNLGAIDSPPFIDVCLTKGVTTIDLSGQDLKRWNYLNNTERQHHGTKTIRLSCITKNNQSRKEERVLAKVASPSLLIRWEKNVYKGEMKVVGYDSEGRCSLVNYVSMEDYLKTLLSREMNGSWPLESLKAQAVAARSYAYYKMQRRVLREKKGLEQSPYDLESSEKFQVSGNIYDETSSTVKAVRETYGEILVNSETNKILPIFYHSKCGGETTTPEVIWGNKVDGVVKVDCPYCQGHGKKDWEFDFEEKEFIKYMEIILKKYYNLDFGKNDKFSLTEDNDQKSEIVLNFPKKSQSIKKIYLRRILGRKVIPGHIFSLKKIGKKIHLSGRGNGHGVGLCQFGAYDLGSRGINYKSILKYYFPNFKIVKVYKK